MLMLTHAKRYDWSTWITGMWRSLVGGGAGAVGSAFGNAIIDPDHFNISNGLHHMLSAMGLNFLVVGFSHMMLFLQTHPAPEPLPPDPGVPVAPEPQPPPTA